MRTQAAAAQPPVPLADQPPPSGPPVIPAAPEVPAAWYPDPSGRHELRWWGGRTWAADVKDGGVQTVDPLPPPA